MSDSVRNLLRRLGDTRGDPAAQAVVSADFALAAHTPPGDDDLAEMMDAACILHWFNAELVAAVLGIPSREAGPRMLVLTALAFVERLARDGMEVWGVHEVTRLAWRRRLARRAPVRYRELAARAAEAFARDAEPGERIEWIYHSVVSDAQGGAELLAGQMDAWAPSGYRSERYALAQALVELSPEELPTAKVRGQVAEVLLRTAFERSSRGETPGLGEFAGSARQLLRPPSDRIADYTVSLTRSVQDLYADEVACPSLAHAYCLSGDVLQSGGRLKEALASFEKYQSICRRLLGDDEGNGVLTHELVTACVRVGAVQQALGRLEEAGHAFQEALAVCQAAVERDPENAMWQANLATACNRVGGIMEATGRTAKALGAFEKDVAICSRLVSDAPDNTARQSALALAKARWGSALKNKGRLQDALCAFREYLAIFQRLVESDPGNVTWQRELAVADGRLGGVLESLEDFQAARSAFRRASGILRQLASRYPTTPSLAREFAVSCLRVARLDSRLGDKRNAELLLQEAQNTLDQLGPPSPDCSPWQREADLIHAELTALRGGTFPGLTR